MNNLISFENDQFGNIRIIEENGKIYFCGKDAAISLGYKDTVNAIKTHCRKDGVAIYHITDNFGRAQKAKFIDEGNLYRLVTHSKLPTAEKFEQWVFDEVLPSIRTTGQYYLAPTNDTINPMVLPDAKDYLTAARLIAHCPKDRMKLVLSFLEKGGFDVSSVSSDYKSTTTADMSDIITETMNRTGYSCEQISRLIGVKGNTLTSYVRKDRFPRPERYKEIVMALNML